MKQRLHNPMLIAVLQLIIWLAIMLYANQRDALAVLLLPIVVVITFFLAFVVKLKLKNQRIHFTFLCLFVGWLIILNFWTLRQFVWYS